jgi:hypothetical protein
MTISGTPTSAGTYNFTVMVSDGGAVFTFAPGPDGQAAARPRGLAKSGRNAVDVSNDFAITVSGGAGGAAGAPTSPWTLAMVMAGLAGAGFLRLRQTRRV